jgi:6-phosphogluconolactonase
VAPFDKESNFKMTYDSLLSHVPIPSDNIHRVLGEKNPYEEKARYTSEISDHLEIIDGYPRFDLVLLGMGSDGHTASIFPGQESFLHTREWVEISRHPGTGQRRITLTGNVINNARSIAFLVAGKEKAEKVSQIFTSSTSAKKLPAFHVKARDGELLWFLDEEAGRFISGVSHP